MGWGLWQPLPPNPPPSPSELSNLRRVSSSLCLLKPRCRAEETHWRHSCIIWGKGRTAPLSREEPKGGLISLWMQPLPFWPAAPPGATKDRIGLQVG